MKYKIINLNKISVALIKDNIIRSEVIEKLLSLEEIEKSAQLNAEKMLSDANKRVIDIEKNIVEKYLIAEANHQEKISHLIEQERQKMIKSSIDWLLSKSEIEHQVIDKLENKMKGFMIKNMRKFLMCSDLSENLVEKIYKITTDDLKIPAYNLRLNQVMSEKITCKLQNKYNHTSIKQIIDNNIPNNEAYIETDFVKITINIKKDIEYFLSSLCFETN